MHKINLKELTISVMQENKEQFLNLITSYIAEKRNPKYINCCFHTVNPSAIEKRSQIFEEIYLSLNVDTNPKNKEATAVEVNLTLLKSSTTCPITGEALSDSNIRIDHVLAKSKSSETDFAAISETGNRWKSDNGPEQWTKLTRYTAKNEIKSHS